LERLSAGDDRLLGHVTLAGRSGRIAQWPQWVSPAVVDAWARRGVERPWIHQREAMDALREGRDVVLATGTGSGKSLAAWTPILSDLVEAEDSSRISAIHRRPTALYLAPTKALAADQLASLMALLGQDDKSDVAQGKSAPEGSPGLVDERLRRVRATTVDGDTPREAKEWARAGADLILSNPDFLHYVMLPSHQRWSRFLASLRLIIIDEAHHWRGVTGSHIALVVRRLLRVAHHLGADPRVVMLSATVRDAASVGRAGARLNRTRAPNECAHARASALARSGISAWRTTTSAGAGNNEALAGSTVTVAFAPASRMIVFSPEEATVMSAVPDGPSTSRRWVTSTP